MDEVTRDEQVEVGSSDAAVASTEYLLGGQEYYEGLVDYIAECRTPMTVSIQGHWGTGKTSAMKTIQAIIEENDERKERVRFIWFDAWPFSLSGVVE